MRDFLEQMSKDAAANPEQLAREHAKKELPKRFYKEASVGGAEGGFTVELDGRTVKTPGKKTLLLPARQLAEAAVAEWNAQEKVINPGAMPLTRIANSAIDAVEDRFAEVADEIARYAGNDALCYRAEEPEKLVDRQTGQWDPILDWAGETFGGRFQLAGGILHIEQPQELIQNIRASLDSYTALQLAALHTVTTITGSAVLAFALAKAYAAPDAIWGAAHVEEDWNIELWGSDFEAERIRTLKREEFDAAVLLLK